LVEENRELRENINQAKVGSIGHATCNYLLESEELQGVNSGSS